MKTRNLYGAGIIPAVAALLLPLSCSKSENPQIKNYHATDFEIAITETRQTHDFVYTYDKKSKTLTINPEEQKLQELWLTKWNNVTMSVTSVDAAFQGANVSSDNPSCVKVNKEDDRTYSLEYVADGTALITAWTSDSFSYSFTVYAKEEIKLEYIEVGITDHDGHRVVRMTPQEHWGGSSPIIPTDEPCYIKANSEYLAFWEDRYNILSKYSYSAIDMAVKAKSRYADPESDAVMFEILDMYPENTSRRCASIASFQFKNANELVGLPQFVEYNTYKNRYFESNLDWNLIKGRKLCSVIFDVTVKEQKRCATLFDIIFQADTSMSYWDFWSKGDRLPGVFLRLSGIIEEACYYPPTAENPLNKTYQSSSDYQRKVEP